ncbi:hypothetical protein Tco_1101948, partial [Tanacetum coccineum]
RTALSPHEIGSWEQSDIKGAFTKDAIPFFENIRETFKLFGKSLHNEVKEMKYISNQMEDEVNQCSMEKKCFEIEKKQLLINNDQLLEENISSDIMCTYLCLLNEVDNCGKCKSLDIELLEEARALKPLDEHIGHASKFAVQIQEMLVFVSAPCPFTESENEKSKKNKVADQLRKSKSSSNKSNFVSHCNANVKNVALSKNSANVCLSCNECLFSANHDACVVKYLNDVQKRKTTKSVKQKDKIQWKPTGRVFTLVGLRWKPTGRMLNMEGKICSMIKTSPTTIVHSGNKLHTLSIPAATPNAKTRMRYSTAKNSHIRAHINSHGHPFKPHNFAFVRNSKIPKRSS